MALGKGSESLALLTWLRGVEVEQPGLVCNMIQQLCRFLPNILPPGKHYLQPQKLLIVLGLIFRENSDSRERAVAAGGGGVMLALPSFLCALNVGLVWILGNISSWKGLSCRVPIPGGI